MAWVFNESYSGAARELNRKGIKTMKGGKWFPMTVKYALDAYKKIDNEQ